MHTQHVAFPPHNSSLSHIFPTPADAPRLTIPEKEVSTPIQVEEGQPLSLICDIEGNPEPTVIWYNHSEPFISETERVTVSMESKYLMCDVFLLMF